jgi:hypothetical protein
MARVRYATITKVFPPPSGSIPGFVSEPDFTSHAPFLSLSIVSAASYYQIRQHGITLFSSHNAERWRLSHEGGRILMRQRQWHMAAPLMPAQDLSTDVCSCFRIRTSQSPCRTKTRHYFLHMGTMLSPTVDSGNYLYEVTLRRLWIWRFTNWPVSAMPA